MKISESVVNFTNSVVANCKLDSLSIFICDKASEQPKLSYLYHIGVTQEAQIAYEQHRIFEQDPYSDDIFHDSSKLKGRQSLILATEISQSETRYKDYWQFLYAHHLQVVGAATKTLADGIYLVIGTHCIDGKHHPGEVPIPQLDIELKELLERVSGQILSELLSQKAGYSAFQNLVGSSLVADPLRKLSPREVEISDLIYQGRQNKQIAYELGLSEYTVDNHLRRIYRKAGVRNRTALAAMVADTH